jgi:transposase
MRGVGLIVAVTVVAEVGDFSRFANPRQLMAYLGSVIGCLRPRIGQSEPARGST